MRNPFRFILADAERKAQSGEWVVAPEDATAIVGTDGKPLKREPEGLSGLLHATYPAWSIGTYLPDRTVASEAPEPVEYEPVEPSFTPKPYVAPSFICHDPVIRVVVDLDNHEHGDFRRATAWARPGSETVVRFGCQKRRISVWRRAGHTIVAKHYNRPQYEAWKLEADEVLAREVPDYVDKRNDCPRGPFDYGVLHQYYNAMFSGRNPRVEAKYRRTLTAEQRRARAEVIVQRRRQEVDHAERRIADIVRLLPDLLDRVEAAIAEARR